jgi:RNA polymerase sigma-70 factor (ECF subfamily)
MAIELESVYRQHFKAVWRLLRRLGVPAAQLDDAAQDVFLVVQRKLDRLRPGAAVQSWVFAITVRVASEYRRRGARRRTELLDEAIADGAPGPARLHELHESVQLLHEVLGDLDEDKRAVYVLCELEQLSVPEIAEVLGANLNTVYSRLRSARKQFAASLQRRRAASAAPAGARLRTGARR